MNSAASVMSGDETLPRLYERLRRLAVSEPKVARQAFCQLVVVDPDTLHGFLELASRPGESRLRQVVAAAVRLDLPNHDLGDWLRRWLEIEADEFTRRAIEGALVTRTSEPQEPPKVRELPTQLVDAYRYVTDRLCHRVRNTMSAPAAQLLRLESILRRVEDVTIRTDLMDVLGQLRVGFQRLGKGVQFDTGDDYLKWQTYRLLDWLESAKAEFKAVFGPADLVLNGDAEAQMCQVRATRFLLDTVFGNLWMNALQAAGQPCTITARFHRRERTVEIVMIDNGAGFTEQHLDTAFQQSFSSNPGTRGRGLLEVAEAVAQLQGAVGLVPVSDGEYRIQITLPVETP